MIKAKRKPFGKNSIFNFGGISKGWYALFCFTAVVILLYASRLDNILLNEPAWFTWVPMTVISLPLLYAFKKELNADLKKQPLKTKIIGHGIIVLAAALVSFIGTTVLSIPFFYFNESIAAANNTVVEQCEVTRVTIRKGTRTNNSIRFILFGKSNRLYGYTDEMQNLYNHKNYEDYYMIVQAKPGLFGTYILEDWELVKR